MTAGRVKELVGKGISAQQDGDQAQAQMAAQDANVQALEKAILAQRSNSAAAKANLARLQNVQGYRIVKAPFAGVVTLRNVDVGALVSTGSTLLFRISQIGTLRTYVNVPQASVNAVHPGQPATLTVSHLPGRTFRGTVAHMANALDPSTRTMLVEVDVPNADGALFPGVFATVDLSGTRPDPPLVVPAGAIVFRRDGAQVAVVQPDHTLRLQKITVGRDYGDRVEILQGLAEGATIVAVQSDAVRDGATLVPVNR
jgi:membrane fusion protein (multidrug efflux system)